MLTVVPCGKPEPFTWKFAVAAVIAPDSFLVTVSTTLAVALILASALAIGGFSLAGDNRIEKVVDDLGVRDRVRLQTGGLDGGVLDQLNVLIGADAPDLTFVLDLSPDAGLARSRGAEAGEDRFERKGAEFHQRVRAEFLAIATREPRRCVVIDASARAEEVLARALAAVEARLGV